jgi:aryl-alcohol dehydrogenase-like predicted oxidoreductase
MTLTRKLNDTTIPALGLGCWAIGGPFYSGDTPLGWGEVDDAVSQRAIDAAVDAGIRFFDTAQAYGCGHSEIVLGKALKLKPDVQIGTKVGYAIDPATKQLMGEVHDCESIRASIEQSLQRLQRDHIDVVHLHLNALPIEKAASVFECLLKLRQEGKVLSFGWSTDFPERAAAFAHREGFVAIQHAMNVFYRADMLIPSIESHGLLAASIIRPRSSARTKCVGGQQPGWIILMTEKSDRNMPNAYPRSASCCNQTAVHWRRALLVGSGPAAITLCLYRAFEILHRWRIWLAQ